MTKKKGFRDIFPALNEELDNEETKTHRIDGVRTMSEESEQNGKDDARTFMPDVVDYIRRCDTVTQAVEIVDFMVKRGEISQKKAREIKAQLRNEGLRSFGSKKERDYYLHHGIEPE